MSRVLVNEKALYDEAEVFGRYLLRESPDSTAQSLYVKALKSNSGSLTLHDQRLLLFVLRHPWSVGLIDSGLARMSPLSEVRRRIYLMFSILESSPNYHEKFLSQQRSLLYFFVFGFYCVKGVLQSLVGALFIKAYR
jgi:hypothetical protein